MTDRATTPFALKGVQEAPCTHPDTVAKFFRALPDPTRLKRLEYIQRGERTSTDRVAYAGISQPRVSVHLSCLIDCGHTNARRDGRKLRHSVGDPRGADLIVLARSLPADNSAALTGCTRIPDSQDCPQETIPARPITAAPAPRQGNLRHRHGGGRNQRPCPGDPLLHRAACS
ncbi:ArsR/SmtB family transcription factor [Streptomyces prasinus]|uniref:ArsR/SmtB family transcription factor n=1 Tax=Streptomyces prasinus TaxID=67345 RepID=UPI003677E488